MPDWGAALTSLADMASGYNQQGAKSSSSGKSSSSSKRLMERGKLSKYVPSLSTDELEEMGIKSMSKGGPVRKTGLYKLHKGEKVVPSKKFGKGK